MYRNDWRRPAVACVVLVLSALLVVSQVLWAKASFADIVLLGGKVFTGDERRTWAQAVAIRADRVAAVGTDAEIRALVGPETRRISLGGRLVIPGINDSHTHLGYAAPIGGVVSSDPANWIEGPDPDATLKSLAELAGTTPKGTWLAGRMGLKIRHSTLRRNELDKVAPDHPVILNATYGHGSMVNSQALRVMAVSDTTPDPAGGWYERAAGSGSLTGLLDGSAQYAAWNAYFSSNPEVMVQTLRRQSQDALRYGITTLQHMPSILGATETVRAFRAAALPVRVRLIAWPYPGRERDWRAVHLERPSPLTYISGVKYVVDGSPLEQWALMRKEYDGRPGWHGRLYYSEDAIREVLRAALASDGQLSLHAVGDQTADVIFRLMGELAPDSSWRSKRVRIEHANGINGATIEQARRFGIVISQPRADAKQILAWHDGGLRVAHGSDGEPGNPWGDFARETAAPGETGALSRENGLRMYTQGSAYAEGMEQHKGTLAPGMLADLAVLSQDVTTASREVLPATVSLLTMVGGSLAYDAGTLQTSPER